MPFFKPFLVAPDCVATWLTKRDECNKATTATNCQSLAFDSSSSFLISNPNNAVTTLAHDKLNAASNTADHILAPALSPSAGECSTWASVCSLGQVVECDNPPTQDISTHKASTFPASPAAQLSALPTQWHASLDRLSPAIDVSWVSNNSVCNNGVYSDDGGLITQHGGHVPSASSWDGSHRISFARS